MGIHKFPLVLDLRDESYFPPVQFGLNPLEGISFPQQLDIWYIWLSDHEVPSWVESATSFFSPEEILKTGRFRLDKDRMRYQATRLMARIILGWYLKIKPRELVFTTNTYGRPELERVGPNAQPMVFNISHAGDLIVLVVSTDEMALGIDVENGQSMPPLSQEAYLTCFSKDELLFLDQMDADRKRDGFWRLWTLKESFTKAIGLGLSMPLSQLGFQIYDDGKIEVDLAQFPELQVLDWHFNQFVIDQYIIAISYASGMSHDG